MTGWGRPRSALVLAACLASALAAGGCGGDGDGRAAGEGAQGGAPPDSTAGSAGAGVEAEAPDSLAGRVPPGDTGGATRGPETDSASPSGAGRDPAGRPPEPAVARRYFVRLGRGVDPAGVAARHGLEPIEVISEPVPALYVALTLAEKAALEADSSVVSVAREIHQGDTLRRPPIRGIPTPDTVAP